MSDTVTLETERLQMRWLTLDDTDLMLAVWNDPAFVRHVGDRGIRSTAEARAALMDGALKLYSSFGYGPFRVALRDSDQAVGLCGLFRRDNLPDPDIGYSTLPDFCANGYAYEASTAVMRYARSNLGLKRICAIISPENEPSIGLIRKLGLRFERMHLLPDEQDEVCLYGMQLCR